MSDSATNQYHYKISKRVPISYRWPRYMPHAQYTSISGYMIAPPGLLRVGGSHHGFISHSSMFLYIGDYVCSHIKDDLYELSDDIGPV